MSTPHTWALLSRGAWGTFLADSQSCIAGAGRCAAPWRPGRRGLGRLAVFYSLKDPPVCGEPPPASPWVRIPELPERQV